MAENDFRLTASYGAQDFHMRWFDRHMEDGVEVTNVSDRITGFQIAGPRARDLLQDVTREDVSDMRFLDLRRLTIGLSQAVVQRVSYTGDLGYEIYVDAIEQRPLWSVLWDAGRKYGLKPFGMRAMMSLRLDRFFGSWMREFSPDYTVGETGLDRFVAWSKDTDFIGRAAAEAERATGPARRLCNFIVDADDADVVAYEPIWHGGEVVGFCTSGGYSHHAGVSVAIGFLPLDLIEEGRAVEIEILGDRRPARLVSEPLFDPDGARMRG
jgi:dimethylglycine dehydrogenase